MKHGKTPTKKHKQAMKDVRLNPDNWLVTKNLPNVIHIVHRETGRKRIIPTYERSI